MCSGKKKKKSHAAISNFLRLGSHTKLGPPALDPSSCRRLVSLAWGKMFSAAAPRSRFSNSAYFFHLNSDDWVLPDFMLFSQLLTWAAHPLLGKLHPPCSVRCSESQCCCRHSLHLQTIQLHMIVRHRCFPVTAYLHLKPKPSLMTLPTSWLCVKLCVSLHFASSINSAARGRWLLFNHFTCEIVLHVTTWQCFCCREEQGLHSMGTSGQEYSRQATTQSVGKPCNH